MAAISIVAERRLKAAQLRSGLASLPNELLTSILYLASQREETNLALHRKEFRGVVSFKSSFFSAVKLSHVCDRFRRVALLAPELWNGISDDMTSAMVTISVIRSGRMPLDVSLTSFPNHRKYPNFYSPKYFTRFLSKTSSRWRSLKMLSSTEISLTDPGISLENLNLPLLAALYITSPPDSRRSESHILRDWNTPNLHSLTIRQFVPPPFQHSTTLSCLCMELGGSNMNLMRGSYTIDTQALRNFLLSCTSLAELQVRIADAQFVNTSQFPSHFSLPNIEVVSFEVPFCSPTVVKTLLEEIRFPTASKLNLVLGINPSRGQGSLLAANMTPFFKDELIFPAVTRLNLTVDCHQSAMHFGSGSSGTISIPFILLANIRHLTLTVTGFNEVVPSNDDVPPLRSLSLQKCDCVYPGWVLDVVQKLDQRGDLGELEVLSITACGSRLRDLEIKCRSIRQGTLLEHLRSRLHSRKLLSNPYHDPYTSYSAFANYHDYSEMPTVADIFGDRFL